MSVSVRGQATEQLQRPYVDQLRPSVVLILSAMCDDVCNDNVPRWTAVDRRPLPDTAAVR